MVGGEKGGMWVIFVLGLSNSLSAVIWIVRSVGQCGRRGASVISAVKERRPWRPLYDKYDDKASIRKGLQQQLSFRARSANQTRAFLAFFKVALRKGHSL